MEATNQPISSVCFKAGNEDLVYASAGNEILSFDVRMGPQAKPLDTYNYNRDEINQIAVSSKGFLAAADDSGDVKIINTIQKSLYKRLREAHTSVSLCSATGMFNSDVSSFYDPSIFFLISLQHVNQLSLSYLYKICSSVQFIPWRPWTGQCYFMLHCLTYTFLLSTCKMQILAILLGFFYFNL
jgi:WD40 repeat protein